MIFYLLGVFTDSDCILIYNIFQEEIYIYIYMYFMETFGYSCYSRLEWLFEIVFSIKVVDTNILSILYFGVLPRFGVDQDL